MEDRRDQRDPTELGEQLLHPGLKASTQRAHGRMKVTLSEVYVHGNGHDVFDQVPNYDREESTVQSTVKQYREEMIALAEEGDAAARIVCAEHGWAYGTSCPVTNGRQIESDELLQRPCQKAYAHEAHDWALANPPGVRIPVEMFRCLGKI